MNRFFLVASDVHSDETAFQKLAEIASEPNCSGFIYAGDIDVDNPIIAITLANRNFVFLPVLGNCDSPWLYQSNGIAAPPVFREITIGNFKAGVSHGHLYTPSSDCDIVISGHTHVPLLEKKGSTVFLNPGSASQPRGYSKASYATIETTSDGCIITIREMNSKAVISFMEVTVKK